MDVSGRLEKYNLEDVAIAFTNETEAVILISGKAKFEAMRVLLQLGMHRKKAGNRVYVAGICLLLEDFLQDIDQMVIDDELPGWGDAIKQQLLDLIWRRHSDFDSSRIRIGQIGEGTPADALAWAARKKQKQPYKKITARQLLQALL